MVTAFLRSSRLSLPFRNHTYGLYAAGNAVSLIGTWMQRVSIGWLTWELTHSGLWLGLNAFADFFPVIVIGPIAGAAADRWDRLTVVKVSQVLSLTQATVLFFLVATDRITITSLLLLTAVQGVIVAFNQPARLALVPSLVGQADLASAVAINSVIFNVARFIGPMLAGLAIVWWGIAASFAANAISYVVFLVALLGVHVVDSGAAGKEKRSLHADLKEGIGYTVRHPAIASLLVLLIAIGIGGRPLNELLPGFAAQVFHSGAGGLSVLASATGAGAILGGLWLGHGANTTSLVKVAYTASLGGAFAAALVCSADSLWAAVPGVALFGFCVSSAGVAIQTVVQLASDRAMRGRVMGLYGLIFRGAPAIGALTAGIISARFGLRVPVLLGSGIVVAACLWVYSIRHRIEHALPSIEVDDRSEARGG